MWPCGVGPAALELGWCSRVGPGSGVTETTGIGNGGRVRVRVWWQISRRLFFETEVLASGRKRSQAHAAWVFLDPYEHSTPS